MDTGGRLSGEGAPGRHRTAGSDWALRAEGSTEHCVVGRSRLRFRGWLDGLQVSVLTCWEPGTVLPVLTTGKMSKLMTRGLLGSSRGRRSRGKRPPGSWRWWWTQNPDWGGSSCGRVGAARGQGQCGWALSPGPGSGGWGPCSELHLQEPHEVLRDDQLSSMGRGNEPS